MRIALIAHLAFPISEPFHGGLEAHTHHLARQLVQRGHTVTLFAREGSDPALDVVSPVLPASLDWEQQMDSAYGEIVNAIQQGAYDVVHNNSLHALPLLLSHTLGCPVVTTFHSPPFPALVRGVTVARKRTANAFVAVSAFLAGEWEGILPHCRVVHNGIEIDRWRASRTAVAGTAIWFGRICPEKGTVPAIRAARMAGFALGLAGPVYDSLYFREEVEPLLGDKICYLGHLDHAGINAQVGQAAVGLFTSTWDEPFGLVIPEMLACGTPVVASAGGAAGEILDDSCGVIVPKGDTAALAAALQRGASLSRSACRKRAETAFAIERMISGYEAIYAELRRGSPSVRE